MIDVQTEPLIRLGLVPGAVKWLPENKRGKRPHPATLYRWATSGLRSKAGETVTLETMPSGGGLATSESALLRFFERLGADNSAARTPSQASVGHLRAEAMLDRVMKKKQ